MVLRRSRHAEKLRIQASRVVMPPYPVQTMLAGQAFGAPAWKREVLLFTLGVPSAQPFRSSRINSDRLSLDRIVQNTHFCVLPV
jgi:hypothetical protein